MRRFVRIVGRVSRPVRPAIFAENRINLRALLLKSCFEQKITKDTKKDNMEERLSKLGIHGTSFIERARIYCEPRITPMTRILKKNCSSCACHFQNFDSCHWCDSWFTIYRIIRRFLRCSKFKPHKSGRTGLETRPTIRHPQGKKDPVSLNCAGPHE